MSAFTEPGFSDDRCDNSCGSQHILVTGAHRSGTTWVGQTLARARKLTYIHEPFNPCLAYSMALIGTKEFYVHLPTAVDGNVLAARLDRILSGNRIRRALALAGVPSFSLRTPLRFANWLHRIAYCEDRLLIKDPIALFSAPFLAKRYRLLIVCLIRNPFGFVASLKRAGWDFNFACFRRRSQRFHSLLGPFKIQIQNIDTSPESFIERASLLWNILHLQILRYQRHHSDWIFLRHEDLCRNPCDHFARLYRRLGLNFGPGQQLYIILHTSSRNPISTNNTHFAPRNSRSISDAWSKYLSPDEVDQIARNTLDLRRHLYPETI